MTNSQHARLAVAVLKKFRLIYGSVRQHFRQIEKACGISGSQLWVIQQVNKTPAIGVSELAARLSIHQSTCSQLVEKLVKIGYLSKTRLHKDQRRVGLTVSKAGARLVARAPGPAEGLLPEALIGMSDSALRALSVNLDRLVEQLQSRDDRFAEEPLANL